MTLAQARATFKSYANRKSHKTTMDQRPILQTDAVVARTSDYRKLMKDIDDHLMKRDVQALKFLCCDVLAVCKQEQIGRGIDLINELEHKGCVGEDNMLFFAELLYHIGRYDLLKKVGYGHEMMQSLLSSRGSKLNQYRVSLHKIAEELTSADVETMKFICNNEFSRMKLESIKTPTDLFLGLEHMQKLGPSNLQLLREMLEAIDKESVLQHMSFEGRKSSQTSKVTSGKGSQSNQSLEDSMFDLQLSLKYENQSVSDKTSSSQTSSEKIHPGVPYNPRQEAGRVQYARTERPLEGQGYFSPYQPMYVRGVPTGGGYPPMENYQAPPGAVYMAGHMYPQHQGHFVPQNLGYYAHPGFMVHEQTNNEVRSERGQGHPVTHMTGRQDAGLPCYSMKRKPRGICLIINNHHFKQDTKERGSRKMPDRDGTNIDCNNLEYIFKKLDFIVHIYTDLTHEQMTRIFLEFAVDRDHSSYDCFICCVLSHGMEGKLYGTNGVTVEIKDLLNFYKGSLSPTLKGKPKMFFIQACQGKEKQKAVTLEQDGPSSASETMANDSPVSAETIPNEADFLLGYAAMPGFVSFRSKRDGTWYISVLVKILDMFHDKADLLSMLIKVNEEVGKATAFKAYKQCPAPMATLRKKVYFL